MSEYVLVCVAWPYANADIHQGNVTGSYLPADIYARFHRLKRKPCLDGFWLGQPRHPRDGEG